MQKVKLTDDFHRQSVENDNPDHIQFYAIKGGEIQCQSSKLAGGPVPEASKIGLGLVKIPKLEVLCILSEKW